MSTPLPCPYFTEQQVGERLTMPAVLEAVERAFQALAAGKADNVPRVRARAPGIIIHSMSAAADYLGIVGTKQYTTTRHGAVFLVTVFDRGSGRPLALIEADRLGQMRTGAVTAIGARYLTPPNAGIVGLYGAGWQAESQLEALALVRPLQQVRVFARRQQQREAFAQRMSQRLNIDVQSVSAPEDAARGAEIVITATTSSKPVCRYEWLEPQVFLAAIGSNWPTRAEIDAACVSSADMIVCDSVLCCQREAGDLLQPVDQGLWSWDKARELAHIVAAPPSDIPKGLIVLKTVGMALEDLAAAACLLQ